MYNVIEVCVRGEPPIYWCGKHPADWCTNPDHATRFPSEAAAKITSDELQKDMAHQLGITSHIWS